jgi:hypothetical protein
MKNVKKTRRLQKLFSSMVVAVMLGACGGAVSSPPAHPTAPGNPVNAGGNLGGSPVNPVGPHG